MFGSPNAGFPNNVVVGRAAIGSKPIYKSPINYDFLMNFYAIKIIFLPESTLYCILKDVKHFELPILNQNESIRLHFHAPHFVLQPLLPLFELFNLLDSKNELFLS